MSESYRSSVGPGDRTWGTVFSLPMSGAESSEEPVQKAQVLRHSQRGIHCPGRAKCFLGAVASEWNLKGLIIVSGWIDGASQGALVVKNRAANAGDVRDVGSISVLGRFPGVGNGNLLQYSCLGNPMDRGACWAIVSPWGCKVSDMTEWLTLLLFHFHSIGYIRWTLSNLEISLPDSFFSKILFPVCYSCLTHPRIFTVFLY